MLLCPIERPYEYCWVALFSDECVFKGILSLEKLCHQILIKITFLAHFRGALSPESHDGYVLFMPYHVIYLFIEEIWLANIH
jgi:hypothetical protein